jgi:hypothetical protein
MTSIYTEFATLPTEIESFSVGGPVFTGMRANGDEDGITAEPILMSLDARRLVFVAQSLEGFARTFPEVEVWKAPWLVFALLGVDVRAGDTYTDGTWFYSITGQPVTHYGFVLGPAVATGVPSVEVSDPLLDSGGHPLLGG